MRYQRTIVTTNAVHSWQLNIKCIMSSIDSGLYLSACLRTAVVENNLYFRFAAGLYFN